MMRSCLGCGVMVAGVVAGVAVFVADPGLPDQAIHAWSSVTTVVRQATSAPTPVPLTVKPTATSLPAAPPAPVWSVFDCAFAVDTLNEDRILDGRAFADGLSPAADPYYYAREAQGWAQAGADATQQCRHAGTLTGTACTAPPAAFALAIVSHQGDEMLHPVNAAWDNAWIASYRRLDGLWALACPGGVG